MLAREHLAAFLHFHLLVIHTDSESDLRQIDKITAANNDYYHSLKAYHHKKNSRAMALNSLFCLTVWLSPALI